MRALRVVGLDEDGETVICEDPENGERFSVPADERLRAAARGDLTRLGQVQIELEAQMRPKEIQARIRGGATVAQLASASGLPEQRLERYAYPVLLERAQIAEMAQRAHPVREDGPDVQTLGEVAAHTFGMRGHDYNETHWDAWRGDDNKWVVQLRWNAGRSENAAHWVFHPGAHGGTVSALDEHAVDLLDPSPNRPLRTVRPVTALAREALELDQLDNPPPDEPPGDDPPPPPPPPRQQPPAARTQRSEAASTVPPLDLDGLSPAVRQPRSEQRAELAARQSRPEQWPDPPARQPRQEPPTKQPRHEPPAEPTGQQDEAHQELEPPEQDEERKTEPTQQRGRKNHPIVPSWEDVLLGVRSHR